MDIKNDLKYNYPHMSQVHMSTTLSLLKEPSNSFNYSFNFISISINSTKLRGLLHSTLRSLGYILTSNFYLFIGYHIANDIS
jgi:hypothetical protein